MNLSRIVAELGPALLTQHIKQAKEIGADVSFLEEHGPAAVNAVVDALLENETKGKDKGRARWIANLAADLLRAWPGEPAMHCEDAVRCAVRIIELSEKAALEHPSRA